MNFNLINEIIDNHELYNNDFFKNFANKKLWKERLAYFLSQFVYFSENFPRVLCFLAWNLSSSYSRINLLSVIYDEYSHWKKWYTHYELMEKVINSLWYKSSDFEIDESTKKYVDFLENFFKNSDEFIWLWWEYSLEKTSLFRWQKMWEWISNYEFLDSSDHTIFKIHLVNEVEHEEFVRKSLEDSIKNEKDFEISLNWIKKTLDECNNWYIKLNKILFSN